MIISFFACLDSIHFCLCLFVCLEISGIKFASKAFATHRNFGHPTDPRCASNRTPWTSTRRSATAAARSMPCWRSRYPASAVWRRRITWRRVGAFFGGLVWVTGKLPQKTKGGILGNLGCDLTPLDVHLGLNMLQLSQKKDWTLTVGWWTISSHYHFYYARIWMVRVSSFEQRTLLCPST